MLSVKLHKKKKPWLGKGSFLIPISDWNSGKIQIRNWIKLLTVSRALPNNAIRYITLVKISDNHPVFIGVDWVVKNIQRVEFKNLEEIDEEIKKGLKLVDQGHKGPIEIQGYMHPDPVPGQPFAEFPELILGKALPFSCVKWTKDIQLLHKKWD